MRTSARPPWPAVAVLGLACIVVGAILLVEPFRSLPVLARLTALALGLAGAGEVLIAPVSARPTLAQITGGTWVVAGVALAVWPDITIQQIAIVVGLALVAGGLSKLAVAVVGSGDERVVLGLAGASAVVAGGFALSWPEVTILVVAILAGANAVVDGLGLLVTAWRLRGDADAHRPLHGTSPWPRPARIVAGVVTFAVVGAAVAGSVALNRAQPGEPGAFYDQPGELPDGPLGTIIRSEVIDDAIPRATTYRLLYTSTGYDGEPTAVSGLVVVPDAPAPEGGRRVLAYTHGTIGVAPRCAPSLQTPPEPLLHEGGQLFVDAGYVIAATDYQGLGTAGPHPYALGEFAAMNELDNVRAAVNLAEADAGSDYVVWGHSQGGQSAAFTGQLSATYAPELNLLGVAAGGPPSDLVELFKVNVETQVGKILVAMAIDSWAEVYDDASLDQIVEASARPIVSRIAKNCLYNQAQILSSAPAALALGLSFLSAPPWEVEPWRTIADENRLPGNEIGAPILLVQSDADTIIAPEVTAAYRDRLCDLGETVEYHQLSGIGHLEVGHEAAPYVFDWVEARFDGDEPTNTCS
jgi:uncharacterized membrane protein HdeD (DUF308 family)/alpha-beta hydrolase superfamily lysophospholipase